MGLNTAFPSSEPAEAAFCVQTAFILYRQLGGSILLYLAVLALNRGRIHWPETKRDGLMIVLQGVSGIWINQFLFLLGLSHTTPNLAAVFQPLCPVVVVLLAVALGFERPTWRKIIGVVFGVGGAFLMAGLSVFQGDASDTAGVFILIAQVIASAVWLLLLKGSYDRYDPLVLTAHQYGVSSICMALTASYCHNQAGAFVHPGVASSDIVWAALAFAVVIASFTNYFIMTVRV